MTPRILRLAAFALIFAATSVTAQGTEVAFGQRSPDSSLPVEVTADSLRVDQTDGTAIFVGNVLVGQGQMRLSANEVRVEYVMVDGQSTGDIGRVLATGNVTFVNGPEAAEGAMADYDVVKGTMLMTGDVILTQGQSILSGERLVVNVEDGTGVMEGRVKTILQNAGGGAGQQDGQN